MFSLEKSLDAQYHLEKQSKEKAHFVVHEEDYKNFVFVMMKELSKQVHATITKGGADGAYFKNKISLIRSLLFNRYDQALCLRFMKELKATVVASKEEVGYDAFEVSAEKFTSLVSVKFSDPLHRTEYAISRIRHGDVSYSHLYSNVTKEKANEIIGDYIYNSLAKHDFNFMCAAAQEKLRLIKLHSFAFFTKKLTFVVDNGFFISKACLARYQKTNNQFNATNL